jgi:hypothetical protein
VSQAGGCRSSYLEPTSNISRAQLNEGTQDDGACPSRRTAQDAVDTMAAYPVGDHHFGMVSWFAGKRCELPREPHRC